jgi:hypothetical protein
MTAIGSLELVIFAIVYLGIAVGSVAAVVMLVQALRRIAESNARMSVTLERIAERLGANAWPAGGDAGERVDQ